MKSFLFFFLFVSSTYADEFVLTPQHYKNFPNSLKGEHFFVRTVLTPQIQTLNTEVISNCRENIAKVVCIVDPGVENEDPSARPCQSGSEAYATYFEQIYDHYPATLQKMFCSLKHIFIEKNFTATAYAGTSTGADGAKNGAIMGIRKSVLDEGLSLTQLASWKEQLSFGGVVDSYTLTPELPMIETATSKKVSDLLYFILAHEFGHMFDFANELNKFKNCSEPSSQDEWPVCEIEPGSWSSISWENTLKPHPASDFVHRQALCFYWCNNSTLDSSTIFSVYQGMAQSDFISLYAATNINDDFADSIAYFLMDQELGTSYVIKTIDGQSYDIMAKLKSPLFQKKYDYIKQFLLRTDIVYP